MSQTSLTSGADAHSPGLGSPGSLMRGSSRMAQPGPQLVTHTPAPLVRSRAGGSRIPMPGARRPSAPKGGAEPAAGIVQSGRRAPPHSPGCFRFCGQKHGCSPCPSPTSTFPNGATVSTSDRVVSHGFPVIHLHFLRDLGSCREVCVSLSSFAILLHFVGRTSESSALDLNYPSGWPRRLCRGPQ